MLLSFADERQQVWPSSSGDDTDMGGIVVYSKQVGARVKRKEDPRLITGSASYVDD